jgi:hypothetical protein
MPFYSLDSTYFLGTDCLPSLVSLRILGVVYDVIQFTLRASEYGDRTGYFLLGLE